MTAVALPALDGRSALGFLASLGLFRLLVDHTKADVRLSFSDQTATAVLHSTYETCQEIADELGRIIDQTPEDGVLPGAAPAFPPRGSAGKGGDPLRVSRDKYRDLRDNSCETETLRWLTGLVTDLGVDDKDRVALSPFCAPTGKQTARSFFEKPTVEVRQERQHLLHALTSWRRVAGFTGEYLDHRVLRGAADHPGGKSSEIGVPGATWLAVMALPLLRLAGDGTTATATLWRRVPGHPPVMVWPLWRQPLDITAVTVLIEHPVLTPTVTGDRLVLSRRSWPTLGVFAAAAAQRRRVEGRNFAGVLAPVTIDSIR